MTYADTYSQPNAPDPVLPAELVLQLARRHAPHVSAVTEVDESGGEARAYLCGDDTVVKTQRPPRVRPRTSLRKEAFILDHLAPLGLPLPKLLGYGREEDVEYLVMTRMRGVPLEQAPLSEAGRAAVLEAVGVTLRRIHAADQRELEASGLVPGDAAPGDLRQRIAYRLDASIRVLEEDSRWPGKPDLREVAASLLKDVPEDGERVTLHSNPGPEHCFVDPVSGELTGLIDFGDAYRSHPALDVRSWFSLQDSRLMLDGYRSLGPVSPGFEAVWRAGIVATELRLVARGHRGPDALRQTISALLRG